MAGAPPYLWGGALLRDMRLYSGEFLDDSSDIIPKDSLVALVGYPSELYQQGNNLDDSLNEFCVVHFEII